MNALFIGLDPLFRTNIKIFNADILGLEEYTGYKDIFILEGHFIRNVEICGIIVAVEQTSTIMTYTVDDGTATILCYWWKDTINMEEAISLGSSVRITGQITMFNETKQIKIHDIALMHDPNDELLHSLQVMALKRDHYTKTFHVPTDILQQQQTLQNEIQNSRRSELDATTTSQKNGSEYQVLVEDVVLEHARRTFDTTKTFSRQRLLQIGELSITIKDIFRRLYEIELTPEEVRHSFNEAFNSLKSNGYIYSLGDDTNDTYKVFDGSGVEEEIINAIRYALEHDVEGSLCGVRESYIFSMVQQKFKTLSRQRIEKCIHDMAQQSIIYKTDPGIRHWSGFQKGTSEYMLVDSFFN